MVVVDPNRDPIPYQTSPDTPSAGTFFSDSPDDSPQDPLMSGTLHDFPKGVSNVDASQKQLPSFSHRPPSDQAANSDIAPWACEGPGLDNGISSGGVFDTGNGKGQRPSSYRPDTARSGASDSPDAFHYGDERRPSMVSATSASSQNSNPRGSIVRGAHPKKLAGFFATDGHESSRSSDTSIATASKRDHSASSHTRRNNSVYTQNSTDGPPTSASSSRPRTPPSSDVTPWLFQDFKVSPDNCIWEGAIIYGCFWVVHPIVRSDLATILIHRSTRYVYSGYPISAHKDRYLAKTIILLMFVMSLTVYTLHDRACPSMSWYFRFEGPKRACVDSVVLSLQLAQI